MNASGGVERAQNPVSLSGHTNYFLLIILFSEINPRKRK